MVEALNKKIVVFTHRAPLTGHVLWQGDRMGLGRGISQNPTPLALS